MASQNHAQTEEAKSIERVSVVRERSPLTYRLAGPIKRGRDRARAIGDDLDREVFGVLVVSKNKNELKSRVGRGVSDRRVYAWFAKGS